MSGRYDKPIDDAMKWLVAIGFLLGIGFVFLIYLVGAVYRSLTH